MAKILIIEDDRDLCGSIRDLLVMEHHIVETSHSGAEGQARLRNSKYDVVIVDWMLPVITGVEVCESFRKGGGKTPILMLTGKDTITDKEQGFGAGVDDYLTKPFAMSELVMRVRALLRRPEQIADTILKARNIVLDPGSFSVSKDGKELKLLPKEFAVLQFFMRHPKQVFSAEALLERLWMSERHVSEEAVTACIRRLRKKIESPDEPELIKTIHSVGYRFEP